MQAGKLSSSIKQDRSTSLTQRRQRLRIECMAAAAQGHKQVGSAPILKKSRKFETVDSRMEPLTRMVLASSRWSSCTTTGRQRQGERA